MKGISVSGHKFSGFFYFILLLAALFPLARHAYAHPGHNTTTSRSTGHGMSMGADARGLCTRLALLSILRTDDRSSLSTDLARCKNYGGKNQKANGSDTPKARSTGKARSVGLRGGRGNQRNGTRTNFGKSSVGKKTGKGNKSRRVNESALVEGASRNELGNNQVLHSVEGYSETSGTGRKKPGTGKKRKNKKAKMSGRQQIEDSGQQADSRVPAASLYGLPSGRSKRQSGASAPVCVNERNFIRALKNNPDGHFIQTADIDMEKAEKHAGLYNIRHSDSPAEGLPEFRGTYNGGGHRLHHIYSKPALFSRLNRAVIKHVDLINNEGPGRGQAFGLEAGLLAGESVDSTFMDVSLNEAEINRGSLTQQGLAEDAKPRSGALVGRSDNSVYVDIRAAGFDVGNDGYPVSGTLIGSGDNNRFSNIYLDDFKVRGVAIGSLVGSGNNNSIVDFFINSSGEGNPNQLVGSGNDTSIRRGVVTGQIPPYYPAGTTVEEVISYFHLSDPATVSTGTLSEDNWRLDPGLVPIPRVLDKNIRAIREKFRAQDAPACNLLACPPPVASDCRHQTEEMYGGQVQDFIFFDDENIYLLVREGNAMANHLKHIYGNDDTCSGDDTSSDNGFDSGFGSDDDTGSGSGYDNDTCHSDNTSYGNDGDGDDTVCSTDRLKSDGCAVNQLSYLSRRGVTVHDTVKNSDNGRIYMVWKRTQTEGDNAYLARYGDDGKFIDILDAGYGHVFNGGDYSLQYRNKRTVLVSKYQAWVIVGEGTSPVELPAHPSLVSYAYGKAIIDDNNSIYLLADSSTEEGKFRSLIKYSEYNYKYELDASFSVQRQFTSNGLQLSAQQSPEATGILVDNDIWVIHQDQTGFHIRSVNRMSGEDSGISIDQYVTEPSQYALRLANDEVQLAYVDGEEVLWHSYNRQGELIDAEAFKVGTNNEVSVSALEFKDLSEENSGETIYVGGVNTTDNRPYASRLAKDDFTTYIPGERPVIPTTETGTGRSTTGTPASTGNTPPATTGNTPPASTGNTSFASTGNTPASTGNTTVPPGSTLYHDAGLGLLSSVTGIGLCVAGSVGSVRCYKKYIKKRRLAGRGGEDLRDDIIRLNVGERRDRGGRVDMLPLIPLNSPQADHIPVPLPAYDTLDIADESTANDMFTTSFSAEGPHSSHEGISGDVETGSIDGPDSSSTQNLLDDVVP